MGGRTKRETWAQHARFLRACRDGRVARVARLLSAGVDVNAVVDPEGAGPFHYLADGWTDYLYPSPDDEPDMEPRFIPPAFDAGVEVFELLSKTAIAVDRPDSLGETPLHRAASVHPRLIELLVACGADIEARDENGNTPFLSAATHNRPVDLGCTQQLIDSGANVNAVNNEQDNALMFNAAWGYANMLTLLIRNGVDVNARDDLGKTPLAWATEPGHVLAVDALLSGGADPNAAINGRTPLMLAAKQGSPTIVRRLIAAGADVGATDADGQTAFNAVKEFLGADLEQLLLERVVGRGSPSPASVVVARGFNEAAEPLVFARTQNEDGSGTETMPLCDCFAEVATILRSY